MANELVCFEVTDFDDVTLLLSDVLSLLPSFHGFDTSGTANAGSEDGREVFTSVDLADPDSGSEMWAANKRTGAAGWGAAPKTEAEGAGAVAATPTLVFILLVTCAAPGPFPA